ncbi:MAG TPA: hypothetical protein VHK06_07140 [Candidatus Limnocylindria bacterium]|nr:hypothetical protein [Candidatus Limnocylindria bacterium]
MSHRRLAWPAASALALILAGCALGETPATGTRSPPSGGQSPAASVPVPAASGSPDAAATDEAVIERFFALASDEALTFRVTSDGSIDSRVGGERGVITVTSDMAVRGRDAVGDFVLASGGEEQAFELLIVDETGYARTAEGWEPIPEFRQDQPVNPFVLLSGPGDLEYVERARVDGEEFHRLRSRVWLGGDVASLEQEGWENPEIEESRFDVLVREDGTPSRAQFTGTLTGTYNGEAAEVSFDFTYIFTEVGEPVEIPDPAGG